jgi:exodeoxyribonuclease X
MPEIRLPGSCGTWIAFIPVPPESSAVHHLIDADLAGAPALAEVLDQFRGADAYVAHNADFEHAFLEELLGDALWASTYKCALRIWPALLSHSNQALRYRLGFIINPFGIDRQTLSPHRALSGTSGEVAARRSGVDKNRAAPLTS